MRPAIPLLLLAAFTAAYFAPRQAEAANAPLCFAIAENYNKCMRQHQRGWRGGYPRYPGPHGGGYGYDDDDYGGYGGGYGGHGRGRRNAQAQAQCAIWIAQMQASGCFN